LAHSALSYHTCRVWSINRVHPCKGIPGPQNRWMRNGLHTFSLLFRSPIAAPMAELVKTTSENSLDRNWAFKCIDDIKNYHVESLEGYTLDYNKGISIIMDRASTDDYSEIQSLSQKEVVKLILALEGDSIQRKIKFASLYKIPYRYALYSEKECHYVWVYKFQDTKGLLEREFTSYEEFGDWLNNKRSLSISKNFGHNTSTIKGTSKFSKLPIFDQALRNNGTPWLANLDGIIFNDNNDPIALLEMQTTYKISPKNHDNNKYYLQGQDINRFDIIEVASIQSGLPWFIITWSPLPDHREDYVIKKVNHIAHPYTNIIDGKSDISRDYMNLLKRFSYYSDTNDKKKIKIEEEICSKQKSFLLKKQGDQISKELFESSLSINNGSFPNIYYDYIYEGNSKTSFISDMNKILEGLTSPC